MTWAKIRDRWKQMRGSRRNLLFLLLVVIAAALVVQFAIAPIVGSQKKVREEIVLKKKMLSRYQEYVKSGKNIEEEMNQVAQQVETIQSKLLPGETAQISAANLQEILKKLSEKNGIQIRSFRIGEPKDLNFYSKIPVIIEINPTKSVSSLTYFLSDIEHYEKLLLITDIDMTAPNMRNPTEVQGNLTVVGISKKAQGKGKTKEG